MILLLACAGQAPEPPPTPDVVLVTLDTLRADRVGAYGDPLAQTPRLDTLAAESALFRDAITPVPLTLPAHTSMFSGQYPSEHGLRDNAAGVVGPEVPLVAEQMTAAGYATGAFVSAYVLDDAFGLDRGFTTYDDALGGNPERPASATVDAAMAWWSTQSSPRMMWVHLFDAHRPYVATGATGDAYRDEVAVLDEAVGRLLDAVGGAPLVIVTSDHGENLWDAQELEHGMVLTRSVLRVPLLVRPPGGLDGRDQPEARTPPPRPSSWLPVPEIDDAVFNLDPVPDAPVAARVVEGPVSLTSVAGTILEYAGLDGVGLRHLVEGASPDGVVVAESLYSLLHYGWAPSWFAIQDGEGMLASPSPRGFAVHQDPWLQTPLPANAALEAALEPHMEVSDGGAVDPDVQARLELLGYSTRSVRTSEDWQVLPDPAERMPLLHKVFIAQGQMASAPELALASLEEAVAEDPRLVDAWFSVAQLRINAFDVPGALQALDALLQVEPTHWNALVLKQQLLQGQEDKVAELEVVLAMLQARPTEAAVHHRHLRLLGELDRDPTEALTEATAAIPEDCGLREQLARRQAPSEALVTLDQPGCDLAVLRGELLVAEGRAQEAVGPLLSWMTEHPDDLSGAVVTAEALVALDRCSEALPMLERVYTARRDPEVLQTYRDCGGTGF